MIIVAQYRPMTSGLIPSAILEAFNYSEAPLICICADLS